MQCLFRFKKSLFFIGLAVVLMPITWAVSDSDSPSSQQSTQPTAIYVNVSKVSTANIPKVVNSVGTLSADNVVTISSVAAGRISNIHFKNGQEVGKDMPIVQLDNTQAKADYQSAVTALNLARTKYNRSKKLLNTAVSQQDLDALAAQVKTAQADVQNKLAALNQLQITAPFSGVLGAFKVNTGDYVNAGDPLVTLVNIKELRVDYTLSENLVPQLKENQSVTVTVSAYPKKQFIGTVNYISPTVDQTTRTVAVEALVPNPDSLLRPGMFVQVQQQIGITKNALVIPQAAVQADLKGSYVYKVVGNKVAQTYITTGPQQNGKVQVVKGLKEGDVIVTAGQQKLQDGSTVVITKKQ